jgi:serine/threonine protein kinase
VLKAAIDTASCLMYLHDNGIAHGDVYAHNMMASDDGTTTLCDYGASFFYDSRHRTVWERMEVRNSACVSACVYSIACKNPESVP